MRFLAPVQKGRLLKRYQRFLVDIETEDGEVITAHCPNPGSMKTLLNPDAECWYGAAQNPNRKLKFDWYVVKVGDAPVGINTNYANPIVYEALKQGLIPELAGYQTIKPEIKIDAHSRLDFLLSADGKPDCYLEVKSITMSRRPGLAEFPDSVSKRAAKHMRVLSDLHNAGARAVSLYLIQRSDCTQFSVAADIDPAYNDAANAARKNGVENLCYSCNLDEGGIHLTVPVPIL